MLFWRFAFAFFIVLPFFLLKRGEGNRGGTLFSPWIIILGAVNGLGYLFQFEAQRLTLAYKTAFFVNLYVVFVALLGYFIGEKLQFSEKIGIFSSLLGMFLLSSEGNVRFLLQGKALGDLLAVGAAITWSFYILFSRNLVKRLGALEIVGGVFAWTWLLSIPLFFSRYEGIPSKTILLGLVYLGVFCTIVPYLLFTYALIGLTAARSALILLLEVVLTTVWSYIFLGEELGFWGIIGGILILLGLFLGGKERQDEVEKGGLKVGPEHLLEDD